MRFITNIVVGVFFAFISIAATNPAMGDFITHVDVATSQQADGSYKYDYSVTNDSGSELPFVEFTIYFNSLVVITDISGPQGWDITPYHAGDSLIDYSSLDFAALPGSTVSFSFQSFSPPTDVAYVSTGLRDDPFGFALANGTTVGPGVSTVPEPVSMIPFGVGIATLAGYSVYRGKREQ